MHWILGLNGKLHLLSIREDEVSDSDEKAPHLGLVDLSTTDPQYRQNGHSSPPRRLHPPPAASPSGRTTVILPSSQTPWHSPAQNFPLCSSRFFDTDTRSDTPSFSSPSSPSHASFSLSLSDGETKESTRPIERKAPFSTSCSSLAIANKPLSTQKYFPSKSPSTSDR